MRQSKLIYYSPPQLTTVKAVSLRNVALIYQDKIIRVATVKNRREKILQLLSWRKLYGPKFRECEVKINFND